MDTASLTELLRSAGWMPSESIIDSVTEERVGGGALGRASRLTITDKHHAEPVHTLIAKRANPAIPQSVALFEHEVRAYRSDIFTAAGVAVPRHVVVTDGPLAPILLLEDLGEPGFRRFETGCTEREAFAVMDTAAALHAEHWECPRERYPWVPDVVDADITRYCLDSLASFSAWPPSVRTHAKFVAAHAETLAARLTGRLSTITHGDFHCLNLSLEDDGEVVRVTVVDLQLIQRATPMLDIARFLGTSLRSHLRRRLDRKLLDHYHARLTALGVKDYPYPQLIEDFRLGLVWNMAVPLAIYANHPPAVRRSIGDDLPLERRGFDAMDDWNCLNLRVNRAATRRAWS